MHLTNESKVWNQIWILIFLLSEHGHCSIYNFQTEDMVHVTRHCFGAVVMVKVEKIDKFMPMETKD